jgi:glycosyltransferase involved in cell wall biosynthesis
MKNYSNKDSKKILILTQSFDLGGITTFVINLANFYSNYNNVTILYTDDSFNLKSRLNPNISLIQYKIPSKFKLVFFGLFNGLLIDFFNIFLRKKTSFPVFKSTQKVSLLNAKISKSIIGIFDIAISSSELYCNYLLALKVNSLKKIGWVHTDYSTLDVNLDLENSLLNKLDKIVFVNLHSINYIREKLPILSNKILYINNIIDSESIKKQSIEKHSFPKTKTGINLITVARIDFSSKRLDRIIQASVELVKNKIDFKWIILGHGKDKILLKNMIENFHLSKHVFLLGPKTNPYPYIKAADLFILPSQYEGLPIVIYESLILGCPVLVTRYNSAYSQVPSKFGIICENNDLEFVKKTIEVVKNKNQIIKFKKELLSYNFNNHDTYENLQEIIKND